MSKLNNLVKAVDEATQDNDHTQARILIADYLISKDDGAVEENQNGIELNICGIREELGAMEARRQRLGYMSSEDITERNLLTKLLITKLDPMERRFVNEVL